MKVLNLRCTNGHGFEGWFASDDDFMDQNGRTLIACPLCADTTIVRMPAAPRLNLSGARAPALPAAQPATAAQGRRQPPTSGTRGGDAAELTTTAAVPAPGSGPGRGDGRPAELQAAWLGAVRKLMANTQDVGPRFAEEARRIHYGEVAPHGIRGQATAAEREALHEEGIETLSIPVPRGLEGPLQ